MFKKLLLIAIFSLPLSADIGKYIRENSENLSTPYSAPTRIYASSPTLLYMLYALSPQSISGINFEFNNYEKPYLKEFVLNQPVVGGFFGKGKIPNAEALLSLNPELILVNQSSKNQIKIKEIFGSIKKPMLYLEATTLDDYIVGFEVLGEILDKKQRANELIKYAKEAINLQEKVNKYLEKTNTKKVRIYYAQGRDGLQTECEGSAHSMLIELSGGENVHKCEVSSEYGKVQISFEQLLKYDPDIILAYDKGFFKTAQTSPQWQLLSAIKNKKLFLIPREPFSWFDRPPSFMRFLGIKWLINLNYKEALNLDMISQTKQFYKLFLDIELNDESAKRLLSYE